MRLTAQRVLLDLLPKVAADAPTYDLDLTGASLEYFDLRGRRIGEMIARRATLYGITRLACAEFAGKAMLTGALFRGRVELTRCRFAGGFSLQDARFDGPADLTDCRFTGFADLRWKSSAAVVIDGAAADATTRLKVLAGTDIPRLPGRG